MKLQELRIGNYVLADGMILLKVEAVGINPFPYITAGNQNWNIEFMKPVPLDEEWLLKFGFRKYSSNQYDTDNFWSIQRIEIGSREGEFYCNQLETYFKYVHELQNIYHALTGNELNTTTK